MKSILSNTMQRYDVFLFCAIVCTDFSAILMQKLILIKLFRVSKHIFKVCLLSLNKYSL